MKKSYIDMTDEERKEVLAQEKRDREALFKDLIFNAPQRQAEAEQTKQREAEQAATEKEVLFKQAVRESFIAANGSELGFNEAWPSLRTEIVAQRTLANVGNKAASPDPITRFIEQVNSR